MSYIGKKPTAAPLTSSDITDSIISLPKLTDGTDGNIISYDASGNPVAVATGTDGQVLTSTGAGSPPAFEALPSTADFVKITSTNISSSVSSVSLDGHFSSTYNHYQIVGTGLLFTNTYNTATSGLRARIRQSNTDISGSYYIWTLNKALSSWNGTNSWSVTSGYNLNYFQILQYITANSSYTGNFVMNVHNPLDTSYRKSIHWQTSSFNLPDGNTSWHQLISENGAASYLSGTAATSGFTFYPAAGNLTGGTITIYGLTQ